MEALIATVNTLFDNADKLQTQKPELPTIVVVGNEGSGKTALLERLIGKPILPSNTRCPVIVKIIPLTWKVKQDIEVEDQEYMAEWVEFFHKPGRFRISDGVKEEIRNEMNRIIPGLKPGYFKIPIYVTIYSEKCAPLTFVDLPGLKAGHENEVELRNLALDYISQPNSIILAVNEAWDDLWFSPCLELAKTVDPKRSRTLSVITKIDGLDSDVISDAMFGTFDNGCLGVVGVIVPKTEKEQTIENVNADKKSISELEMFGTYFTATETVSEQEAPEDSGQISDKQVSKEQGDCEEVEPEMNDTKTEVTSEICDETEIFYKERSTGAKFQEEKTEQGVIDEMEFLMSRYPEIAHLHGIDVLWERIQEKLINRVVACLDDAESVNATIIGSFLAESKMLTINPTLDTLLDISESISKIRP